jgi:sugar lactone lactonase YvrE
MRKLSFLLLLLYSFGNVAAQSLSGVESVEYDPVNNRYLASSDGTSIIAIAPDGGLSHFGSGLVADYGMEVVGNTLFAIAGTRIKGYDLTSAAMVMDLNIPGALFLNGLATNGSDRLWATDFNGYDIYEVNIANLSAPSFTMVADQTDLGTTNRPNGIVYDGDNNRVVFVNWGSNAPIKAMDLSTYNVTTLIGGTGLGNIDGIARDGQGNWYVSSWSPARITRYANDFSTSETITVPGISNPADICYATATDTLAIPGGNQVLFVGFQSSVVGIEAPATTSVSIRYFAGLPQVGFELTRPQTVTVEVVDMGGRVVYTAMEGQQNSGRQTIVLAAIGLESGAYVCRISSPEVNATERFVIP